ncbi:MAG: GxxExxY protein [Anaerolineae bacterium]
MRRCGSTGSISHRWTQIDIEPAHQAQLLNYLAASGLHVGLILNFGTLRLGLKRMVR